MTDVQKAHHWAWKAFMHQRRLELYAARWCVDVAVSYWEKADAT